MPELSEDVLKRLKQTCVFITGPDGTGTGYLVAPQRIGTALHVVKSWQEGQRFPVVVGVGGPTCQASLLKADPATDSAVLGFDDAVDATPLPIAGRLKRNVAWEGYGFPALSNKSDRPQGLPIDGDVKDPDTTNDVGQSAILLYSGEIAAGNASPLHGFSGSPVVVEGALVGHLTKHIGDADDKRRAAFGYVYACPIGAVARLLDVAPQKVSIAPPQLQTIAQSIPSIEENQHHVFVSYRSTDRPWAMSLVARLEGAGLSVFFDQKELVPGGFLAQQLETGLKRSRAAVVLVTKGWLESPWCQQEANVLVKRAVEDETFKLVPLRLDNSTMPELLDSRVWLDFNGTAQAEGKNLERLLSVLVDRDPAQVGSVAAHADAADVRVIDEIVAEIRSAARGDSKQILKIVDEWRKTASTNVAPLIAAAGALNSKGQFESALKLLDGAPTTLQVRQLRAFALRKMGKIDEGIELLEALHREGQLDPETGGLLAGSYKARWLKSGDNAFLQQSYQVYRETYARTGNSFNGINAAAMALQCGDQAMMYQFAGQVRDCLSKKEVSTLDHWELATLGEACLLFGRFDDARDWYAKAAGKAAGLHQDIAVMRRQARLDLKALHQPQGKLDDALPVPRVLAYFGHMVDADDRPTPRFPASKVGVVRKAIRGRIEGYGALHGFGQAARGTDLIVLEELVKRDLTATVVLPIPEVDFLALSGGGQWNERFSRLQQEPHIEFTPPLRERRPSDKEMSRVIIDANREVQRRAIEYASRLDETPVVLAIWDGKKGDGPGGTADAVGLWQDEGFDVDVIDITKICGGRGW